MSEITKAVYDGVVVERLRSGDINDRTTRAFLELRRDAYAAQLEPKTVPRGTISAYTERRLGHLAGERKELQSDSPMQLWVVRDGNRFASAVKTRPSSAGLYIVDVLTQPNKWRRGLGGRALLAALMGSGLHDSALLSLDAFVGSGVNDWYKSLGFKPQSQYNKVWFSDDRAALIQRYLTPRPQTLGYVVARLAAKAGKPRLFG